MTPEVTAELRALEAQIERALKTQPGCPPAVRCTDRVELCPPVCRTPAPVPFTVDGRKSCACGEYVVEAPVVAVPDEVDDRFLHSPALCFLLDEDGQR